ncbi:MAG: NAD(P)/FAD-dependent oxidoreductase [Anaerolineae bacterium]|nr:NAD(P)/FAD-dependent oxidoreductase [Anaerolineae bacterium]
MRKSLLIIGAGVAGLSVGCYAQMNGYQTHILEHHTCSGGVCTAWQRRGYTIDGCIHWLLGSKPGSWFYELFREVGVFADGDPLIYIDRYLRLLDETTGQSLDVSTDFARLEADLLAISPQDRGLISEIFAGVRRAEGFLHVQAKPRELMGVGDYLQLVWSLRRLIKYVTFDNVSTEAFAARMKSPFLRWAIPNIFLPETPIAGTFLILNHLSHGELSLVRGGSQNLPLAIDKRYRELGGKVTYKATVEKILVKDDRAVGVRLADGTEHYADVVISAADGQSTIFSMLEGKYVDQKVRDQYENWELTPRIIMVSFGVDKQLTSPAFESIVAFRRPIAVGGETFPKMWFRTFDYDPTLAPAGKSLVQGLLFSKQFDTWVALKDDRSRYEAEKKRAADEVLSRLEAYYPGMSEHIEVTDVASPYTFWRYARCYQGVPVGFAMTPARLGGYVKKTLPGLKNFYMAGQWLEPGGGVPLAVHSARQTLQLLCHDDGEKFQVS